MSDDSDMNDVGLQVIDLLTNLDPTDLKECNRHELNRIHLAVCFAQSVLAEAVEDFQRRELDKALAAAGGKPIDVRLQ